MTTKAFYRDSRSGLQRREWKGSGIGDKKKRKMIKETGKYRKAVHDTAHI